MVQLNAFVARSFAGQDEPRIRPILNFLDTFKNAGFVWDSAEPAEVESVSRKVQRLIDEKEVFIGFFTRKYPIHSFSRGFGAVWLALRGRLKPSAWTAPSWVLQESGYALSAQKKLILLREEDVEVPALQGDLEYISFDPANPQLVFPKLSEMIHSLLAKAAGLEVKITVSQGTEPTQLAIEAPALEPAREPIPEAQESDIIDLFFQMDDAAKDHDMSRVEQTWSAGTELIRGGKEKDLSQLSWDCLYYERRFWSGAPDGLENLKRLRQENADSPTPILAIARCLSRSEEYDESARLFLEAASLQEGTAKARAFVRAAENFGQAKSPSEGLSAIKQCLPLASGDELQEAVVLKYDLEKQMGRGYLAFAGAESALHDNPNLPIRFTLGLDYHRRDLNELALHHFRFLYGQNGKDASALHNLSLLYAECGLPITSVSHYKKAVEMGETLSTANLAFMYLDCGMADEAKGLVDRAMGVEGHAARIEKCLAEIMDRRESEGRKEEELLAKADGQRRFLLRIGQGLGGITPPLKGTWKFPFGDIPLSLVGERVSGTVAITIPRMNTIGLILSGSKPDPKTETYVLGGKITGAVCEFELEITTDQGGDYPPPILLGFPAIEKGLIVFAPDGKSGEYAKLSDGKLDKIEKITKRE